MRGKTAWLSTRWNNISPAHKRERDFSLRSMCWSQLASRSHHRIKCRATGYVLRSCPAAVNLLCPQLVEDRCCIYPCHRTNMYKQNKGASSGLSREIVWHNKPSIIPAFRAQSPFFNLMCMDVLSACISGHYVHARCPWRSE